MLGNRIFYAAFSRNTWALSTVFPPSGVPKKYRGGVGRRKPCFLLIVHILYKYNNQDTRIWGEFSAVLPRIIRYRFAFHLVIRLRKSFFFQSDVPDVKWFCQYIFSLSATFIQNSTKHQSVFEILKVRLAYRKTQQILKFDHKFC